MSPEATRPLIRLAPAITRSAASAADFKSVGAAMEDLTAAKLRVG
jgi:hypothetical protein